MAKILLVDDDQLGSQIYSNKLQAEKHEVVLTIDGEQALAKLNEKYDVILLDIMMPKIGGTEVLKQIKEGVNSKTPVLIYTNLLSDTTKQECLKLGAREYLLKADFTPLQLVEKIKTYLKPTSTATASPAQNEKF